MGVLWDSQIRELIVIEPFSPAQQRPGKENSLHLAARNGLDGLTAKMAGADLFKSRVNLRRIVPLAQ